MRGLGRSLLAAGVLSAACLSATADVPAAAAGRKSAIFNVSATHAGPGMQVAINSKVWVTPTEARADVKNPLEGEVTFLVARGSFYQLDPKARKYMKGPLPPEMRKNKDNFAALVGKFAFDATGALKKSKRVRSEAVSGYECDVFTSTATEGDATRTLTVWVPQKMEPQIPLKAVMQDRVAKPGASMERSVTITLSNLQLNVPIAASVFAVPAGYKQVTGKPRPPKAGK